MLTIGKLAGGPGAGRYYVDQVASGREDYYAGEGEAPGVWVGNSAAALGLSGQVDEDGLSRLLESRDPVSGEPLRRPGGSGAVAGFDLTFRAPKSVSVVFGIADAEVAGQLRAAHQEAVADALGYLEREACWARRGAGGAVRVEGRGFVAAAFEHRASRAGDPLLHTHVVVGNVTQGPDGRWTALDGRLLYRHAKTAGFLYQAALRAQVRDRLGLEWEAPASGVADLAAVPRAVIDHFSQRRAEIVEHMALRGEHSARAAQIATLETRRAKTRQVPIGRLREEWRSRAAEHGLSRSRLEWALRRRHRRRPSIARDTDALARRLEGPDGLTRHRSTFTRRDVLQAFAEAARDGAILPQVEGQTDAFLARDSIVPLKAVAGERRFTTRELLGVERGALARAERWTHVPNGVADEAALAAAIATRTSLSDEQRDLVEALTRGRRGIDVVRAPAGTGKTFALDAAREAWCRSGVPVLGCALSARAACELRDQAGVDATTIARLSHAFDRGVRLPHESVLIVDEAGMVGTRDLARLSLATEDASAKLVLVGDDRQLPEIQAGGLFATLADRLGALELREVRRQRESWDRDALSALRRGDVERFAEAYHAHGRIVIAPRADAARGRLVGDWLEAHERGERAVMVAHRRRDVADLNGRARYALRELGHIGPDQLVVGGRAFALGDRVVARRNDRRLGVVNGEAGLVAGIEDGCIAVELDGGKTVGLPEAYVRSGNLDHGYALTAHLAQGTTVDRAYVLGSDELYREWGYTALSRHRAEARFYVSGTPAFLNRGDDAARSDVDVTGVVSGMLAGSRAQRLALEGVASEPRHDPLVSELERARHELTHIDSQLEALRAARSGLRWYQRAARQELAHRIEGWQRPREHWRGETERLARELDARPEAVVPPLSRARDPLVQLRPVQPLERRRAHDRGLER